jgi:hypothetical protein
MAGYRETFGANVDYAYGGGRGANDIGGRLQSGMSQLAAGGKGISQFVGQMRGASRSIKDLGQQMSQIRNDIANATDPGQIRKLTREFENARTASEKFGNQLRNMPFDALEKGLGSVVKGLMKFNTSLLGLAFDFVIDSIKRVYELQEKWTEAIGGFNMKIGGMSAGLKGATKAAVAWSSTVRGLTNGDIRQGIEMFGEFTEAIGRTVEKGDAMEKWGLTLARGFNLGGQGAGKLSKSFDVMGDSAGDVADTMKDVVKGANAAGVPVNMLAKGLAEGSTYMVRFGKDSQHTFVQGASFAAKFRISISDLQKAVEGFDSFDDAAKSASKLNTAFGTMINSMDLMMEDDPAKRLDSIRQQMLAQGMTYDKLTPKQRRYFSETMKLSEDQTAALLDSKNANMSYTDFQAKQERKQKDELNAKEMMNAMLQKTAQTMYAFGAAFDRVTLAIGKAIKPLLEVLGLAKTGDKNFKGFGSVMEGITDTVVKFFESLAGNDRWMDFMKELGNDLKRAGSALKDFVLSGRAADWVGDLAKGMKSFYVTVRDLAIRAAPMLRPVLDVIMMLSAHIKELALAWGAMKAFNFANNAMGGGLLSKVGKVGGGLMSKGIGGMAGRAALSGGIGAAIGGKGAGIGAAVGSIAGSFLGPIGMVLGPIVGGFIGRGIEALFNSPKVKTQVEKAQEHLAKTMEEAKNTQEGYDAVVDATKARLKAEGEIRKATNLVFTQLEQKAKKSKEGEIILTADEAKRISERADSLGVFTTKMGVSTQMLESLGEGSRLTTDQLHAVIMGSSRYEKVLSDLKQTAEEYQKIQQAQLESSLLGAQKGSLEAQQQADVADLKLMKMELEKNGGMLKGNEFASQDEILSRQEDMFDYMKHPENHGGAEGSYLREAIGRFKKLDPKDQRQIELSVQVRAKEKKNAQNQEKLIALQLQYTKQQAVITARSTEMQSQAFANFKLANPSFKNEGEAFDSYLSQKKDELVSKYGESGFDLINQKPDFSIPKLASGGVVMRPTKAIIGEAGPEAVIPLSQAGGYMGGGQIFTQNVEVHIDGQKVGRALVRSAIRGRN